MSRRHFSHEEVRGLIGEMVGDGYELTIQTTLNKVYRDREEKRNDMILRHMMDELNKTHQHLISLRNTLEAFQENTP